MTTPSIATHAPASGPLARFLRPVRRGLQAAADLLVPPVCVACREPVARHDSLCPDCWGRIDFIRPPVCFRLGLPLPYDAGPEAVSARALAAPPAWYRARSVARHAGTMRDLVHRLKYDDQHHGLRLFSALLVMAGSEVLTGADLLIPVPLARGRLWQRGFNQAALLAHAVARRTGVPDDPLLLRRIRATRSQVGLSLEDRRANVAGAFALAPQRAARIRGRRIVVIDDVVTTGSTVEAVTKVLLKGGAAQVDVLSLSLVTDDVILPS